MNPSQARNRPTKGPMRGRGGVAPRPGGGGGGRGMRRAPMGSMGGMPVGMSHAQAMQANYNVAPVERRSRPVPQQQQQPMQGMQQPMQQAMQPMQGMQQPMQAMQQPMQAMQQPMQPMQQQMQQPMQAMQQQQQGYGAPMVAPVHQAYNPNVMNPVAYQTTAANVMPPQAVAAQTMMNPEIDASKPRSKPPMSSQTDDIFTQFNTQPRSMPAQDIPVPAAQPAEPSAVANPAEPVAEEQAAASPSKKPSSSPPQPKKRVPPWIPFTGTEKAAPQECRWAHRVRQILSADTLRVALLKPRSVDQLDRPEIWQITLDGVNAPRPQRREPSNMSAAGRPGTGGSDPAAFASNVDQPFAYEAREFVRQKVMNQNVFFAVWKENTPMKSANGATMKRWWGDIYFKENGEMKSLTHELVANGYAALKEAPGGGRVNTDLHEKEVAKLKKKQEDAKTKRLGMYVNGPDAVFESPDAPMPGQPGVRNLEWIGFEEQKDFGETFKGKVLDGIVDQVLSGSTIRVELCTDPATNSFKNVIVNIAGINCPKVPQKSSSRYKGQQVEDKLSKPFGAKAREWTEERLLNQRVQVKIVWTSNRQIIAQIIHNKGRIAPSLLKKGLAQYQTWSAKLTDAEERKLLRASSETAQAARVNIWAKISPEEAAKLRNEEMMVRVVQIISGDTIVVEHQDEDLTQERFTLSSIRAPRLGIRGRNRQQQDRGKKENAAGGGGGRMRGPTPDEYLAREAKEMVRKMTIGQQVRLVFEYSRENQFSNANGKKESKKFASVYVSDKSGEELNVALELIKKGYAEIVWHAKGEMNRSEDYALLEEAYEKARKEKKGVNQYIMLNKERGILVADQKKREAKAKETAIKDFSGISESDIKLNELIALNQYLTSGKVKGIIEYVFGANRVKVYIPSKNVCIAVRLADIRCGDYRLDIQTDPHRERAKKFLNATIMQREVTLQITSTGQENRGRGGRGRGRRRGRGRGGRGRGGNQGNQTRNPNLDGHIYLDDVNIAEYLLENGLASVIRRRDGSSVAKSGLAKKFEELEDKAKSANVGIWPNLLQGETGDDAKNEEINAKYLENSMTERDLEVVVSHIDDAISFFVNVNDPDPEVFSMNEMNKKMQELQESKDKKKPKMVQAGSRNSTIKYAALYDGFYARARVQPRSARDKEAGDDMWFVNFIDFGNNARVNGKQFVELPAELRSNKVAPLALRCKLAGLSIYDRKDSSFNDGGNFFAQFAFQTENQKLKMKVLYHDQHYGVYYVELFFGDKSINQMIAREGYVMECTERDLPDPLIYCKEYGKEWSAEHAAYVKSYFDAVKVNIGRAKGDHKNIFRHGDITEDDDNAAFLTGKK